MEPHGPLMWTCCSRSMTSARPGGKFGASSWCRRESTHSATALAALGMQPDRACRNCAGGFGDGAGHGEGSAWVYTNLMVACNSSFAMPSVAKNKDKAHNAMFTCTASVSGCAHEWVRTLACVACDWRGIVLEYVAQYKGIADADLSVNTEDPSVAKHAGAFFRACTSSTFTVQSD